MIIAMWRIPLLMFRAVTGSVIALCLALSTPAWAGDPTITQSSKCEIFLSLPRGAQLLNISRFVTTLPFEEIINITSEWASRHAETHGLKYNAGEFREGMSQRAAGGAVLVTSALRSADGVPSHWAFLLEHAQGRGVPRRWRVDFALNRVNPTETVVNLQVHYYDTITASAAHIPRPSYTMPRLLESILAAAPASSGLMPVSAHPVILSGNDGPAFRFALSDPNRRLPIIYVTSRLANNTTAIDPRRLARMLQGTALVLVDENSQTIDILKQQLPKEFLAWNGVVRVYRSEVQLDDERDSARHRYYTADSLDRLGEKAYEAVIQAAQRALLEMERPSSEATTVYDVESLEREQLLLLARERIEHAVEPPPVAESISEPVAVTPAETVSDDRTALVATYQAMLELLETELASVRRSLGHSEEQRELISMERDDALQELNRLTEINNGLQESLSARSSASPQERQSRPSIPVAARPSTLIFDHLSTLPDSVPEVLTTMAALFPDRLYFTERAHRSARQAAFDNPVQAWRAFIAIARDLYEIHFGTNAESYADVDDVFRQRTGLELARTESAATRANPRMMRLREDQYEGKTIVAEAHVKLGRPPKAFRIHYYVDRERRRIVISHAGDHLETAGTSRM